MDRTPDTCFYCENPATVTIEWLGERYQVCRGCLSAFEVYTGLDLEVANE